MMKKISSDNGRLFVYSFSHLCVDALCCYLLYQLSPSPVLWILVYHGIAFALQPVIGYVTDRYHHFNYGLIAMIFIGLSWAVFYLFLPSFLQDLAMRSFIWKAGM